MCEPPRRVRRTLVSLVISIPLLITLAFTVGAQQATTSVAAAFGDSAAPARRAIRSWTSDRRDFSVGDIITVMIDESTVASANKATNNTDSKRRTMNAGAQLPASGAVPGASPSLTIGSNNDGSTRQQGDATRSSRFAGEMSVRVVAVTKEGNLQVKGSKLVDVDKNRQEMTLSGIVRPSDISSRDLVESQRIADLQLVYAAKGSLGKAKTGILTRVLGVFWP